MSIEELMEVYVERGKKERLRDEFAMAALAGMLARTTYHIEDDPRDLSEEAYQYADAMLRAREVKP